MSLTTIPLSELLTRLTSSQISSIDVTTSFLGAITERDDRLHAFLHVDREDALRQAEAIDRKRAAGQPVGLLASSYGGTRVQSWISLEALKKDPAFENDVKEFEKAQSYEPELQAAYPEAKARYEADMPVWKEEVGATFQPQFAAWRKAWARRCCHAPRAWWH